MPTMTCLPRETSYAVQIHEKQGSSQLSGRFVEIFDDNGMRSKFNRKSVASGNDARPDFRKIMQSAQLRAIPYAFVIHEKRKRIAGNALQWVLRLLFQ